MTDNSANHYHVIADQDWGGSQEYSTGNTEPLTLETALQFADDTIRADAPNRPGAVWVVECADPCSINDGAADELVGEVGRAIRIILAV
jgi:hypothetical protein